MNTARQKAINPPFEFMHQIRSASGLKGSQNTDNASGSEGIWRCEPDCVSDPVKPAAPRRRSVLTRSIVGLCGCGGIVRLPCVATPRRSVPGYCPAAQDCDTSQPSLIVPDRPCHPCAPCRSFRGTTLPVIPSRFVSRHNAGNL